MKKWFKVVASLVGVALVATLFTGIVFAQGPAEDGDGVRAVGRDVRVCLKEYLLGGVAQVGAGVVQGIRV